MLLNQKPVVMGSPAFKLDIGIAGYAIGSVGR
jgi:hypothetical protein